MFYYEVYVGEIRYQDIHPLTYQSQNRFRTGSIISVPYGKKSVQGFIKKEVKQPSFPTKDILDTLSEDKLPDEILKLHEWMLEYYPYGSGPISRLFTPKISRPKSIKKTKFKDNPKKSPSLIPTKLQMSAINEVINSNNQSFLIHGQTGSGKTLIYIEITKYILKQQKSVIILVPEISLIKQTEQSFSKYFADKIIIVHSELTKSQHNKNWLEILESKTPKVIIGTRSAIFAPISKVGLIIVDESHEPAYKQDSSPRYNTLRVVAKRAALSGGKVIYGSATPSISEYYLANKKQSNIIKINSLNKTSDNITASLVDLKDKNNFSKHPYLADSLLDAISLRLSKKEQSLIFLNRRGTAKQIMCTKCGWQYMCARCDLPLTLHADIHMSKCHTCGFQAKPVYECPECKNNDIIYRSLGTKAMYDVLSDYFPSASIMRFDTDNKVSEKLINNYEMVRNGHVDIIIGTQLLGKGLDLPHLSLVGLVNADTSLAVPDFSSAERNYQLIHQAIGRVGRGHRDGEVILQTFRPDDLLINAALNQDWDKLYSHEIQERRVHRFPPFYFMLKITLSRKSSKSAETKLKNIRKDIEKITNHIDITGPLPSFYEKNNYKYNWHLIIRAKNRAELTKLMNRLPKSDQIYDIDPINLL